jgi:hypothetical protein
MSAAAPAAGLRDIAAAIAALDAGLNRAAALGPNWDGHRAPAIDPDVLRAVRAWGQAMPGWAFAPAPAVVPLSSGGVHLEWHVGPRVLELEFESPETVHYLRWDPARGVQNEDTDPARDRARSEELFGWVHGGTGDG